MRGCVGPHEPSPQPPLLQPPIPQPFPQQSNSEQPLPVEISVAAASANQKRFMGNCSVGAERLGPTGTIGVTTGRIQKIGSGGWSCVAASVRGWPLANCNVYERFCEGSPRWVA